MRGQRRNQTDDIVANFAKMVATDKDEQPGWRRVDTFGGPDSDFDEIKFIEYSEAKTLKPDSDKIEKEFKELEPFFKAVADEIENSSKLPPPANKKIEVIKGIDTGSKWPKPIRRYDIAGSQPVKVDLSNRARMGLLDSETLRKEFGRNYMDDGSSSRLKT